MRKQALRQIRDVLKSVIENTNFFFCGKKLILLFFIRKDTRSNKPHIWNGSVSSPPNQGHTKRKEECDQSHRVEEQRGEARKQKRREKYEKQGTRREEKSWNFFQTHWTEPLFPLRFWKGYEPIVPVTRDLISALPKADVNCRLDEAVSVSTLRALMHESPAKITLRSAGFDMDDTVEVNISNALLLLLLFYFYFSSFQLL